MSDSKFDDRQLSIVFSRASRMIKIGFLNVKREHVPQWIAFVSFVISNLQTIALLLSNGRKYLPVGNDVGTDVIDAFIKIFGFAEWFSYTSSLPVTIWTIVMFMWVAHYSLLGVYINIKLTRRTLIPDLAQKYWSLLSYFHPLVFFYPMHTFCVKVIENYYNDNFTTQLSTPFIIFVFIILWVNFWGSFVNTQIFYVVIKTKDALSVKNNFIRSKDLITKTIVPFLWVAAESGGALPVIILLAVTFDCITRDLLLFYYLPYYNIEILKISAAMQGAITSLAVLTLITKGLSETSLNLGQYFLHGTWILLIPLFAKIYTSLLFQIMRWIIASRPSDVHAHYALHKLPLLRYIMKKRTGPTLDTRIFNKDYFLFEAKMAQIFEYKEMTKSGNEVTKIELEKIMKDHLLGIIAIYPKCQLAKVTLANYYVKKEGAYLLANNLIEDVLNDAPSFPVRVSLSLIRFELQEKLYHQYSHYGNGSGLNLLQYIQANSLNDEMKQKIKHQVRKQLEFWDNFLSSSPDMGTLTELALKVGQEKIELQKTWKELMKIRPPSFYSPPLIYGMYISLANNDAAEGDKFIEQYHSDIVRTSRLLEVDELNNDTMMAEDVVQISMSGSRTKIGYILDCSANIQQIYGWKKEFLINQPMITIMTPYYQQKHDRFLMSHYNTGSTKLLNNTSYLPVVGSDGYIRPSRVHIKMHPFVERGISYVAVMKRIKEPRRWVLVRRDGTIDGMSKNFATDMNIFIKDQFKGLSIFSLCPGFKTVNSAFNMKTLKTIREHSHSAHGSLSPHMSRDQSSGKSGRFSGSGFDLTRDSERALGQAEDEFVANIAMKNIKSALEMSLSRFHDTEARAQAIYDSFTKGSSLAFFPQKNFALNGNQIKLFTEAQGAQTLPILYNVQIITRIHDKDFIKVVYLDKSNGDDDLLPGELPNFGADNRRSSGRRDSTMSMPMGPLVFQRNQSEEKHVENVPIDPFSGRMTSHRPLMSPPSSMHESRTKEKRVSIFAQEKECKEREEKEKEKERERERNAAKIYAIELHETEPYEKDFNEDEAVVASSIIPSVAEELNTQEANDLAPAQDMVRKNMDDIFSSARQNLISTKRFEFGEAALLQNAEAEEKAEAESPESSSESPGTVFSPDMIASPTKQPQQDPLGKISQVTFGKTRFGRVVNQVIKSRTGGVGSLQMKLESVTEEHIKEPLQEENLLRKKLRKLRERLNKGILEQGRMEGSVASSYLSRGKKVQALIVRALDVVVYKRPALIFSVNFFVFILIILGLQLWQSLNVTQAISDVKSKMNVVENGAFRLNNFLTMTMYSRLWLEVLKGDYIMSDWIDDNDDMRNMVFLAAKDAEKYNNLLWQQVTEIDEKYQKMFYTKNIRIYEVEDSIKGGLMGYYTNFEATALIFSLCHFQKISQISAKLTSILLGSAKKEILVHHFFCPTVLQIHPKPSLICSLHTSPLFLYLIIHLTSKNLQLRHAPFLGHSAVKGLILDYANRFISTGYPPSYDPTWNLDGLMFILDNFYDDFLYSSESTTLLLAADLQANISDTDTTMLVSYLLIVVNSVFLLGSVSTYLYRVRKDSARFMNMLFRLEQKEAHEVKSILRHFIDTLDSNVHEIEELEDEKEIRQKAKDDNARRVHFRSASMGKLYKTQILVFTRLLPFYLVLVIWTLSYFLVTKSTFKEVKKQQTQIQSTLYALINDNLVVTEFIELINTNSSITVESEPISEDLLENLEGLKDIDTFINQFRDSNGNLNTAQQQVFYGFPCSQFANYNFELAGLYVESCEGQSLGTGQISFTSLTTELYAIVNTFYTQYLASEKSEDALADIFFEIAEEFEYLAILTSPMCTILYRTARDKFEDQATIANTSAIAFSVITIVAIALGAVFVWFYVIKKMFRIEATDKDVLRMIPVRMILSNQYLKQYLLQNSNRLLDNVKSFL